MSLLLLSKPNGKLIVPTNHGPVDSSSLSGVITLFSSPTVFVTCRRVLTNNVSYIQKMEPRTALAAYQASCLINAKRIEQFLAGRKGFRLTYGKEEVIDNMVGVLMDQIDGMEDTYSCIRGLSQITFALGVGTEKCVVCHIKSAN